VERRKTERVNTARFNNNLGTNKRSLKLACERLDELTREHGGTNAGLEDYLFEHPDDAKVARRREILQEIAQYHQRGIFSVDAVARPQRRALTLVANPLFDSDGNVIHIR
jgi:hypothetical protein